MSGRYGETGDCTCARPKLGSTDRVLGTGSLGRLRVVESRHPESGQTTVVMVLFLATFLCGFIALGIDMEVLFHAKRQAQAAADAAAVAAAEAASQGIASEQSGAEAVAKMNGFDTGLALNPAVVTIHQVPTSGNYTTATSGSYLEVIVSQPIRTFFAGMVTHKTTMLVSARAVGAAVSAPSSCVCLEGTTGTDLALSNGVNMLPAGCGTTVNSNSNRAVTVVGGSVLGGVSIGSVSPDWYTWNGGGNINNGGSLAAGTKVVEPVPAACSPAVPPRPTYNPALCTAEPTGGAWGNFDVGPYSAYGNTQSSGVVCYNGLIVGSNGATVNLRPGVYVINNGSLHFESGANSRSNTGGIGVTFYLTGTASLTIDNGANVNLVAPTTGTYAGVVVLQDSGDTTVPRAADTQPISIAGGATMNLSGTIFAPTANVNLSNGSNSTVSASLIANTLTMTGGTTLKSMPITGLGAIVATTAKLIE